MRGFSLVELSIVLVILGLLTGGILTGQSLIRASELRAVSTEYQRFVAAGQTFRDKYFAIPGDFNAATRFWGRLNSNADCVTNSGSTVASPGTCDGNGDGIIGTGAANQSAETLQFWRQLALAGLIEGTYTGLGTAVAGTDNVLGTNAPRSKLTNAGWGFWYLANYGGDGGTYAYDYTNMLGFGGYNAGTWPLGSVLKPEEAWNIDTKMDDGLPGSGKILPRDNVGFGVANSCTTSTSQTDKPGAYRLTTTAPACALHFARTF